MPTTSPIIVALDFPEANAALEMAKALDPGKCRVKVGKELFTSAGPAVVESLQRLGFEVFLDLKFHDIPNTTASAVRAAAELGVWMVNVHASGGRRMMEACRDILERRGGQRPLLTAVTILTSLEQEDLQEVGVDIEPMVQVQRLARLTQDCGLDGVVCSAREARALRGALGEDFLLVTPGIRPADSAADDQKRIVTPAQALENGSSYLVIGRPITRADEPGAALEAILATL
ncbi:orotidine-5'-phosphate decarboxylase [Halopseudomonas aestusnigri]|mgnify:CR=1 FL=1|jgi:orotidine-5'-phosphate decarboxylase|uniref:orotidine-5'-phosphate decarboxylase n=1 Tax=Halopseudomonas TaxID=2901189 RepID=UPI000C4BA6FE|nr:orotidine-5'-phosphate decarboxylase [Halopseudomonas aestusnigri]MAK74122.1 orotidine-5'-phosphate decarboxylase [Pseudomonadales bacterium]MEE2800353.1 orotidine-5'-phosphate decarboxylase [Pseudomonadota bacterium]HBT56944.1 orotidine-5'-phosphate decarboxylase [Pseudomonas sp.]MAP75984.1 orotidine-5'-phosphate decarboxylase [Pseudomonadales bacterium]MAY07434.1 orotidine-5'-phosphate decarboxylase [Pseudomonadales bacterium]|tara:strand:- start:1079 stop:1774 length:696 start_codon:yes stop_codon:yes gene_type:complete